MFVSAYWALNIRGVHGAVEPQPGCYDALSSCCLKVVLLFQVQLLAGLMLACFSLDFNDFHGVVYNSQCAVTICKL